MPATTEAEVLPFRLRWQSDCPKCCCITMSAVLRRNVEVAEPFDYLHWYCSSCGWHAQPTRTADSEVSDAQG